MLKNLYKYEFSAMLRRLVPVWGGLIVLAIFCRITKEIGLAYQGYCMANRKEVILGILYLSEVATSALVNLAVGVSFIYTLVIAVIRFYKNIFSGEGYFTMCMPFKADAHILCKAITAFCCIILTIVVSAAAELIFIFSIDGMKDTADAITIAAEQINLLGTVCIVELIILIPVMIASAILSLYAVTAFGQNFKSKFGGFVLGYFICDIGLDVIYSLYIGVGLIILPIARDSVVIAVLLGGFILLQVVLCVLFYLFTRYRIKNRLNI